MPRTTLAVKLSDFVVHLKADKELNSRRAQSGHYRCARPLRQDLVIEEKYGAPPSGLLHKARLSIATPYVNLYSRGAKKIFVLRSARRHPAITACFDAGLRRGIVYSPGPEHDWMETRLGSIIPTHFLTLRRRLLFHACGVNDAGKGYLFLGHSGDGKTTTAHLWKAAGAGVVNDEQVGVFRRRGRIFIGGEMVWGRRFRTFRAAPPAKLAAVFFLRHGKKNKLSALTAFHAWEMMQERFLASGWDKSAFKNAAELLLDLLTKIPCFTFFFVPQLKCVDFIRSHAVSSDEGKGDER